MRLAGSAVRGASWVVLASCARTPEETAGVGADRLVQHGVVACVDPTLRETLGPLHRASLGSDWEAQSAGSRWPVDPSRPRQGMGVAVEDFDGDGRWDVLLPNFGADELYFGAASGGLVRAGLDRWPDDGEDATEALVPADVDGDGDLDVVSMDREGPNSLFRNDGSGTFVEEGAGLDAESLGSVGASFADLDLDGDLDLLVANHAASEYQTDGSPDQPGDPDRLYENDGSGSFVDVTDERVPAETNDRFTYMAGWYDTDGDLYPDLYRTNDYGPQWKPNTLLRNSGPGMFADASEVTELDIALGGMGMAANDLNDDGVIDFVLTNFGPIMLLESAEHDFWYRTEQVREVSYRHETGFYGSWGVDLADLDNDADLDLVAVCGQIMESGGLSNNLEDQPDVVYLREGEVFVDVTAEWGMGDPKNGRGLIVQDLDDDGSLDLVKRRLDAPAEILHGRCSSRAWLRVRLDAPGPNTRGVGARIDVEVDGKIQTRWMLAGGRGFTNGTTFDLHFGLADADSVDAVRVIWSDGASSTFKDVPTRQRLTVVRDRPW